MPDAFHLLVSDLAEVLGSTAIGPHAGATRLVLCWAGHRFVIEHGFAPADLLTIYCSLGPAPQPSRAELHARLLESNLLLARGLAGCFGTDPASGEVVYVFNAPLHGLTAVDLLHAMAQAASQASDWKNAQLEAIA